MKTRRIAVIGGGVAGLTAAHFLDTKYDVTLYEKSGRLGGNAYTHVLPDGQEVDIGACVFGFGEEYLQGLFTHLGIETARPSSAFISLHDLDRRDGLYIDFGLSSLIAQRFAILHLHRLKAIWSFYWGVRRGLAALERGELQHQTMREAMVQLGLEGDALHVVMFGLCLFSSMPYEDIMDAPADFFFSKLKALRNPFSPRVMLGLRCAADNTRSYVEALSTPFADRVVLNARVTSVRRDEGGVTLAIGERAERFDAVVMACNADQALALLEDPSEDERRLLGQWRYTNGLVVAHNDHSAFPDRALCQGFTFLFREQEGRVDTSVSGACWHLPGVASTCDYFGSQHPNFPIREDHIAHKVVLRTPIFDAKSVATISELASLNGRRHTYYCGSHFGRGLHEDAVRSAVKVADDLGVPWSPHPEGKGVADKTVLITGAAGGIGRALTRRLHRDRANLILVDRDADGLSALASELRAHGQYTSLRTFEVDLASALAIDRLGEALVGTKVDVLVNNAGVVLAEPFEEMDVARFEDLLSINLVAVVRLTKALLPQLIDAGGVIVNVASGAGLVAPATLSAYSASKFGVVGFSEALRAELKGRVSVSVVCPAFVNTEIIAKSLAQLGGVGRRVRQSEWLVRHLGISPDRMASIIVSAIEDDPGVLPVGAITRVAHLVKRLSPRSYDRLAGLAGRLLSPPPDSREFCHD